MRKLRQPCCGPMRKIASSLGALALLLMVAPPGAQAQFHGGGGGHFGGGGMGHFGGGGGIGNFGGGGIGHFGGGGIGHFGGGGIGHFGGGGIGHFGGGMPHHLGGGPGHFGGHRMGIGRSGGPGIGRFNGAHGFETGGVPPHGFPGTLRTVGPGHGRIGLGPTAARLGAVNRGLTVPHFGAVTPRSFAERRRLFGRGPLHAFAGSPFRRGRFRRRGWFGPIFWPYAYGDFFYYALWPDDYDYDDPFWYDGYDDIYEGMFGPYDYAPYVRGRRAPARMRALTDAVTQSCADEAAEVTAWPIGQIEAAVSPSQQQKALLDSFGTAVVKASQVIKAHCPTTVSFTPTGRIATMQQRLDGLVQAVKIVQPPLAKFYDALSDEQKARFNAMGAPGGKKRARVKKAALDPQAQCDRAVMAFPTERIDQAVRPDAAQRAKLDVLQKANAKAADLIKAACPSTLPLTPPGRLATEGRRLQAMLTAVETIRPPLQDFYDALSSEQKARFDALGRQLFAPERHAAAARTRRSRTR